MPCTATRHMLCSACSVRHTQLQHMLPHKRLWSKLNDWSKQRYQSNYEAAISVVEERHLQYDRAPVKLSWLIYGFPQHDQEALFQRLSVKSLWELDLRSTFIFTGLALAKFMVTIPNLSRNSQWALLLGLLVANAVYVASLYPPVVAVVVGKHSPYTYRVRHAGLIIHRLYALAMIYYGDVRDNRHSLTSDDPGRFASNVGKSSRLIGFIMFPLLQRLPMRYHMPADFVMWVVTSYLNYVLCGFCSPVMKAGFSSIARRFSYVAALVNSVVVLPQLVIQEEHACFAVLEMILMAGGFLLPTLILLHWEYVQRGRFLHIQQRVCQGHAHPDELADAFRGYHLRLPSPWALSALPALAVSLATGWMLLVTVDKTFFL